MNMDNTTAPTESTAERAKRILDAQDKGLDEHYDVPPAPKQSAVEQDDTKQRGKPGRKPAPTTEELEIELYQLNLQSVEIDSRRRQIRSILKEKY